MQNPNIYDVAVIGGGLAGLSLAIQCARKGYSVVLFEKETYPFHKVCGEYISLESWSFLENLGIPLSQLNLPIIKTVELTDTRGRLYDFELPLGGFGMSRFHLDHSLYKIALQVGVRVLAPVKVNNVVYEQKHFKIQTPAGDFFSKVAAAGYGKRSNLDIKINRDFVQPRVPKLSNFIGVKYHVNYTQPRGAISLHNFKDGYCGISQIEDNKCCLCYMTTAKNLQESNNSIREMERSVLGKNPALKKIFSVAKMLYDHPLVISQISFSSKTQVEEHLLMVGDAAGMITPLCGNGMSMALHGSKIAYNVINEFLQGKSSRKKMEEEYAALWKRQFAKRLWVGRTVQRLFGGSFSTRVFLNMMKTFPGIARVVVRSTHGKTF